jgi:hypothetical protein
MVNALDATTLACRYIFIPLTKEVGIMLYTRGNYFCSAQGHFYSRVFHVLFAPKVIYEKSARFKTFPNIFYRLPVKR